MWLANSGSQITFPAVIVVTGTKLDPAGTAANADCRGRNVRIQTEAKFVSTTGGGALPVPRASKL